MRRIFLLACTVISFSAFAYAQPEDNQIPKLIIFFSPACHKCLEIKNEVLPAIENKFKGKVLLEYRDITDIENYKWLLSLAEEQKVKGISNTLPVFYLEGRFLNGKGNIRKQLEPFILGALNEPAQKKPDLPYLNLVAHFKNLTPLAVISAGLIDGINPCAFTVIVFFISFLTVQGYRRRELLIIGLSFIFTVCLTYILVGLGIFGFLYRLNSFWFVAKIFNMGIAIFSIILGLLALYDFFRFKQTKSTEGLILQLPAAVKSRIHSLIGLHYRKTKEGKVHVFRLVLAALSTGFLVSLLEAVCTGQVYLPTITFVFKTTPLKLQALAYLLLYNLVFILPLFLIFFLGLWGTSSEEFAKIFKQHLLSIKILMAFLFLGLGIFLLWRA